MRRERPGRLVTGSGDACNASDSRTRPLTSITVSPLPIPETGTTVTLRTGRIVRLKQRGACHTRQVALDQVAWVPSTGPVTSGCSSFSGMDSPLLPTTRA